MILGGFRPRDVRPADPTQSRAVPINQRCERPQDHRPHQPYVRRGSDADYACPGGPPDPTLFDADQAEAS